MNEEQLVKLLKDSDKETLKMIYLKNRDSFINFARKHSISEEDIVDVYQDAIIVLQEKIAQGKLESLTCSISTFLFGIGKYMLYEKARKNNKTVANFSLENEAYNYKEFSDSYFDDEQNEQQILLQKGFSSLGKKCKEVLKLFYYRGFTLEEIAVKLNYSSKNVVKSQKSRCIKQLKDKIGR